MTNRLSSWGFVAITAGAGAMTAVHVMSDVNPLYGMISEYAFHPYGVLLAVSLTAFAGGSALFAMDLARRGAPAAVVGLVTVWSCCMLMIAAFPTDRPGVSLSMAGGIHRYAAFAAFVVMPAAGLLVAAHGGRHARLLRRLSLAAGVFLVLVLIPYGLRMAGADTLTVPAGLTQRLVVVTEVGVLALIGLVTTTGRLGAAPARLTRRVSAAAAR
ncbi:hypothetical protein GCM10009677_19490 [Sphaerisporangium rubeum]|uniref:DUF998 domain-containing protein n=1 Tax=Sphaerisporangium rubeum TaxID=321317 RepID=A0A7X0IHQ2_9ACTN|nr:DUF998 domain-containing protein [Sphaerisporangium rubeum]MBB6475440.1 hypothetical protein [Sphaerisporangium rubeum]